MQANQVALVQQLLEAGADPRRATTAGITPLHSAVILGRAALAARLLAAGADSHAADQYGRTPIDWARLKARPDVLEVFKYLT